MGPALPTSLHACIYFPSFACCNLLNNFSAYTSPHLLQLGCRGTLPNDPVPESALEDEGFLKQFHHALLEVRGIVRAVYCIQPGELNSHFASLYCEMAIPRLDPRCASNYTRCVLGALRERAGGGHPSGRGMGSEAGSMPANMGSSGSFPPAWLNSSDGWGLDTHPILAGKSSKLC
eukprot:1150938-Pelagomonas_calceolata.AAC.3